MIRDSYGRITPMLDGDQLAYIVLLCIHNYQIDWFVGIQFGVCFLQILLVSKLWFPHMIGDNFKVTRLRHPVVTYRQNYNMRNWPPPPARRI